MFLIAKRRSQPKWPTPKYNWDLHILCTRWASIWVRSSTAPSRTDPLLVFPLSWWCPPQETSQPHPPQMIWVNTWHHSINSLRPSDTYMHQWNKPSLVQIMACCLFDELKGWYISALVIVALKTISGFIEPCYIETDRQSHGLLCSHCWTWGGHYDHLKSNSDYNVVNMTTIPFQCILRSNHIDVTEWDENVAAEKTDHMKNILPHNFYHKEVNITTILCQCIYLSNHIDVTDWGEMCQLIKLITWKTYYHRILITK